jgi:hypothetical protein
MKTINKTNVQKRVNQFTLENLTTSRAYIIGEGWQTIKVNENFFNESIEQITDLIGGFDKTKRAVKFTLRNTPIYQWFASRIVYEPKRKAWYYIAGQDYYNELKQIRKELTK